MGVVEEHMRSENLFLSMEDHSAWRKERESGITKIWGGIQWEYITPLNYWIPQSDWKPAIIHKTVKWFCSSSGETDQTERQNKNVKTYVGQEVLGEWLKKMEIGANNCW